MKSHIVSRFIKWGLLLSLFLAFLIGFCTVRPTFSQLQNTPASLCRFLLQIPTEGLSSHQMHRQTAAAGMTYVFSEPETPSFSGWLHQLPKQLLASQLHVLAAEPEAAAEALQPDAEESLPVNLPTENPPAQSIPIADFLAEHDAASTSAQTAEKPKIILYCTHSSESYTPSSGDTHVVGGHGLINEVALHLADSLSQNGLPAKFVFAVHDWPSYDDSYTESRKTVNQILEENSENLIALFDVHRDSIASETKGDTIQIQGKKAAKILLVVGTDQRKPHPNWQQNLAFAEKIQSIGEERYPGLIRGITKKAGTYHQELFPGALLLEFGTDWNTVEEASYAAELMANILQQVFALETNKESGSSAHAEKPLSFHSLYS